MGKVPSFLGAVVDSALGTEMTAMTVQDLASQVRRIVFHSPKLVGERLKPLGKVEIHVGQGNFRSYTPAGIDSAKGEMTLLIHLHGNGVGSNWARDVKLGSKVKMFGPEGSVKFNSSASHYFCFGDETALGAFLSLQNSIPSSAKILGAIEVAEPSVLQVLGLPLNGVAKTDGEALLNWAKAQARIPDDAQIYLLGRARTIQALRHLLTRELQVPESSIRTKAYWADGKRGL